MAGMERISISLEKSLVKRFDREVVGRDGYPSRSEAMKILMRDALVEREWKGEGQVAGAVSLVYNHHRNGLLDKITSIQHDFTDVIISSQHVHLDHDNCLEIVVVRGMSDRIRLLLSGLNAVKGVKHHSMVATTVHPD